MKEAPALFSFSEIQEKCLHTEVLCVSVLGYDNKEVESKLNNVLSCLLQDHSGAQHCMYFGPFVACGNERHFCKPSDESTNVIHSYTSTRMSRFIRQLVYTKVHVLTPSK